MLQPLPEQSYADYIAALVTDIDANPLDYRDYESLIAGLIADDPLNEKLIAPLTAQLRGINAPQVRAAFRRLSKAAAQMAKVTAQTTAQMAKAAALAAKQAAQGAKTAALVALSEDLRAAQAEQLAEIGGVLPENEQDFVDALMQKRGYAMAFDGAVTDPNGRPIGLTQVENSLHLTASRMLLTAPRGKVLAGRNISRALVDWMAEARAAAKNRVIREITAAEGFDADRALAEFNQICNHYFREPDFASAVILKFIWQVKRKLAGLPIKQHHVIVLEGPQDAGKTTFIQYLCRPIQELTVSCDVPALLDDANFQLRESFAAIVDELAGAGHQALAKLKVLVTGGQVHSRLFYSHITHKQTINLTCIGSVDQPLGLIVYDPAGMRRFVEISVMPRREVEPHWHQIEGYEFGQLWQAVDERAADPLIPHLGLLQAKAEDLRQKNTVELWLEQFEFEPNRAHRNLKPRATDASSAEFHARALYPDFRAFETTFYPANKGTSLAIFGKLLTNLIDRERASQWTKRTLSKSTLYRYRYPVEFEMPEAALGPPPPSKPHLTVV